MLPVILFHKYGSRDDGGPHSFHADGGLGNVGGADDFAAHAPDFFFLVPGGIVVKLNTQSGGKHKGGQIFGVIAGLFVRLAKAVVFRYITVGFLPFFRNSQPDGRGN